MTVRELIRELENCLDQGATVYVSSPTGGRMEVSMVDPADSDSTDKILLS